jgi:hypothetical protein
MSVFREISEPQKKAVKFLQSELSDGARKEVIQLQTLARTQGIYPRTLTSARKMLPIVVFKEAGCGRFVWRMQNEVIK